MRVTGSSCTKMPNMLATRPRKLIGREADEAVGLLDSEEAAFADDLEPLLKYHIGIT
jgi:hypothetical protein